MGQIVDEVAVGVADDVAGQALVVDLLRVEGSVAVDRIDQRERLPGADAEVVLAEGRRQVDEAGTFAGRHVVVGDHPRRLVDRHQVERPLVRQPDQLGP